MGGRIAKMAISTMQGRKGRYDPKLLNVLGRARNKAAPGVGKIKLAALQAGMLLVQDVMATNGSVGVPRGHEVTEAILTRLRGLAAGSVREPLLVSAS